MAHTDMPLTPAERRQVRRHAAVFAVLVIGATWAAATLFYALLDFVRGWD